MAKKDKKSSKSSSVKSSATKAAGVKPAAPTPKRDRPKVKAKKRIGAAGRGLAAPKEIAVFDPDQVEKALDALPGTDDVLRVSDLLQGMAHPSRVLVIYVLSVTELCVGDIAAVLQLSLSATSTMLKHMRSLGLVAVRHAGKQTYYSLPGSAPRGVLDALSKFKS